MDISSGKQIWAQRRQKLERDHALIRARVTEMAEVLKRNFPPDPLLLASMRWNLSSQIIQHLIVEDRFLYSPMIQNENKEIARLGSHYLEEMRKAFDDYIDQIESSTPEKIRLDWDGYRKGSLALIEWKYERLRNEELQLFDYMDSGWLKVTDQYSITQNWARKAFAIKDHLFSGLAEQSARAG